MSVWQAGQLAVRTETAALHAQIDVHLPTGLQHVTVYTSSSSSSSSSQGRGTPPLQVFLVVKPFLRFYALYAKAEDDELEVKISSGGATVGKMLSMWVYVPDMHVTLSEPSLCKRDSLVELQGLEFGQATTKAASEELRKSLSRPVSPQRTKAAAEAVHKDMTVAVALVRWPEHCRPRTPGSPVETAVVESILLRRSLEVAASLGKGFIDTEKQEVRVHCACFQSCSPAFLEWMAVSQDLANLLPSSRFAHSKHSKMLVTLQTLIFSTEPEAAASAEAAMDQQVVVHVTALSVLKTASPFSSSSQVSVEAELFEVDAHARSSALESSHSVAVVRGRPRDFKGGEERGREGEREGERERGGVCIRVESLGVQLELGAAVKLISLRSSLLSMDYLYLSLVLSFNHTPVPGAGAGAGAGGGGAMAAQKGRSLARAGARHSVGRVKQVGCRCQQLRHPRPRPRPPLLLCPPKPLYDSLIQGFAGEHVSSRGSAALGSNQPHPACPRAPAPPFGSDEDHGG